MVIADNNEPDWAKVYKFRDYVRARKLVAHNDRHGRHKFAEINQRKAAALEAEYPDFPAAFDQQEQDR